MGHRYKMNVSEYVNRCSDLSLHRCSVFHVRIAMHRKNDSFPHFFLLLTGQMQILNTTLSSMSLLIDTVKSSPYSLAQLVVGGCFNIGGCSKIRRKERLAPTRPTVARCQEELHVNSVNLNLQCSTEPLRAGLFEWIVSDNESLWHCIKFNAVMKCNVIIINFNSGQQYQISCPNSNFFNHIAV